MIDRTHNTSTVLEIPCRKEGNLSVTTLPQDDIGAMRLVLRVVDLEREKILAGFFSGVYC